jgi:broad specificity phosphatase PhoE
MTALLLVRHAQASLGAADYDQLSSHGRRQSAVLGAALARRGVVVGRVLHGTLKRHEQTAEHAGFTDTVRDDRWNEFDHEQILAPLSAEAVDQKMWQHAKRRWAGGEYDEEYTVTFAEFQRRVMDSLDAATEGLGSGRTVVVVTSAGVIASAVAQLWGAGADVWHKVQTVTVNTGVTVIAAGSRGLTLVSFNGHFHLSPADVTYG